MDIRLAFDTELQGADLVVADGVLQADDGLRTAILISLFSDARASRDDVLPTAETDRRGWWADTFSVIDGDRIGSRLWLLARAKQTNDTLALARGYARDALAWLIDDGIASSIDVATSWQALGVMRIDVDLTPATTTVAAQRYSLLWDASYAV